MLKLATPLLADVATSAAIVTVPELSVISIASLSVKVTVPPKAVAVEFVPSVTVITLFVNFALAIEPANIAFVTPNALTFKASLVTCIEESSTSTSKVLFVFDKAAPAVICPAPENCATVIAVDPNVGVPSCVNTYPLSALIVPFSTKVNAPPVISEAVSASGVLVNTKTAPALPVAVTL